MNSITDLLDLEDTAICSPSLFIIMFMKDY